MDVLLLSRLQFAFTIMFHYLFPPLTIGLGVVLVYLEGDAALRPDDPIYEAAAKFWTKIFGLNFAMGVVTGIVMEFEFGTNWAAYSRYVGDVFGSALAAEGIFAFFLESGFLAVLLFGWDRVGVEDALLRDADGGPRRASSRRSGSSSPTAGSRPPPGSSCATTSSTARRSSRAEITDFWAMVFNPSSVDRLVHVWLGAFILGAFFVMSISAWYLLKGRHVEFAERSFTGGLILATALVAGAAGLGALAGDRTSPSTSRRSWRRWRGSTRPKPRPALSIVGLPDDEARARPVRASEIPGPAQLPGPRRPRAPVRRARRAGADYGRARRCRSSSRPIT